MTDWHVYLGGHEPHDGLSRLPAAPPWRSFEPRPAVAAPFVPEPERDAARAERYAPDPDTVELVNAALYLRRPLLVTGNAGTGKSTLAYAIAHELKLGRVLRWPITSRATQREGLYQYDPLSRLYAANAAEGRPDPGEEDIGSYIRLGPLGTAFLPHERPRVLLIDEIDKSDLDLPNDLLTIFEEGEYEIPELVRLAATRQTVPVLIRDGDTRVDITGGRVRCREFPVVVMTSNGEREFPPAFKRRCVQVDLKDPSRERLLTIVENHLGEFAGDSAPLVDAFLAQRSEGQLATDQLLNAIFLTNHAAREGAVDRDMLARKIMKHLSSVSPDSYGA